MATLSDMLSSLSPGVTNTLSNAGTILGQNMARRGGLLGLPLGALIGGASQNALQQRQQGVANTLANQIRTFAAQSKDPAEQAQLNMAANMANAGMDPSSLLHIAKTAAAKGNWKTQYDKSGKVTGYFNPDTQETRQATGDVYASAPKAPSMNTPFAANMQGYLLTHPGDEAGAAAFAQQKDLETQIAAKRAGERPDFGRVQLGDKIYTYNTHDPSSMQLLGNAPPSAANTDTFSPVTLGGTGGTPEQVYNYSHKHGGIVGGPLGTAPPKKRAGATRASTKINGYTYQTLKRPDGSMIATLSDDPGISGRLASHLLGTKIPKTLYFKPGSTKPIALPPGVNPADVESVP